MIDYRSIYEQLRQSRPVRAEFHTDDGRGGQVTYTRNFVPPQRLILLGGGHISLALCRFASELDFAVTVADDRPAFANAARFPGAERVVCDSFPAAIQALQIGPYDSVAVLTRGHRWDGDCLRQIFTGLQPGYLGLIGSRRRVTGLFALLREEGFDPALMESVHTPIGLEIGAVTPREIAISILAELIACRRREKPQGTLLEQEDADLELLEGLARADRPLAVAVVVRQTGSTPVHTGAMMTVDALARTAGTVGGGCGEQEIIRAALGVLRTGRAALATVDMRGDIAEEEGMVCGGTMDVWIEPAGLKN